MQFQKVTGKTNDKDTAKVAANAWKVASSSNDVAESATIRGMLTTAIGSQVILTKVTLPELEKKRKKALFKAINTQHLCKALSKALGIKKQEGCTGCYDPPQLFFTPSGPSPSSGTLVLPAPPVPQPLQPLPIQPATTPGSPMQVDPANVPLLPMTERTPDNQLWLPSDATALYQPSLIIHMQPPEQQYHSQALRGEPISPEHSTLRQSLSAMFNIPIPPHAYT